MDYSETKQRYRLLCAQLLIAESLREFWAARSRRRACLIGRLAAWAIMVLAVVWILIPMIVKIVARTYGG
jgi:cell division septal protein FtsQ